MFTLEPSVATISSGQLTLVIDAPASWKSFTPFPSWSSCVLLYPLTEPLELIVGFASPSIPSSLGSLSVEVPYASSTSKQPSPSESRSLESGFPSPSVSVFPLPS